MQHDPKLTDALARVSARILEDAAFVFTDSIEQQDCPSSDTWNAEGVSLGFRGKPSGRLHMWAGEGFARCAAANMLGVDEQAVDAQEKGMDALMELLNMIVGNLLTEHYTQSAIFDLDLPRRLERAELAADCAASNAIWLAAEDNHVLFTIEVSA
jgi:CheY-specific phosphatase CheX